MYMLLWEKIHVHVQLAAPCYKPIECILCQRKKQSEYMSSNKVGRSNIVVLGKLSGSIDTRAARVLKLTAQEQGIMKCHASFATATFSKRYG